jgi:hypothetical protein
VSQEDLTNNKINMIYILLLATLTLAYILYRDWRTELPTMEANTAPYEVGKNYIIRTVTHTYTGKLIWVGDKELVLENPAWVADSGRWMQAVQNGTLDEVEPMNEKTIVGRGAIIDASVISWDLPKTQK